MTPTDDAFRALARSSPWRWRTLHFVSGADGMGDEVEAWVRRPGRLDVLRRSGVDAGSVQVVVDRPERPWPPPAPQWRPDGLVARRPVLDVDELDDPMWHDYRWVAMLDPAELAHHVGIDRLRADTLHGRPVWRADLRPVAGYAPRCGGGCCELLVSEAAWLSDDLDDPAGARPVPPDLAFPDHHDVALDLETGVLVWCVPVGGSARASRPIDIRIIEVG